MRNSIIIKCYMQESPEVRVCPVKTQILIKIFIEHFLIKVHTPQESEIPHLKPPGAPPLAPG